MLFSVGEGMRASLHQGSAMVRSQLQMALDSTSALLEAEHSGADALGDLKAHFSKEGQRRCKVTPFPLHSLFCVAALLQNHVKHLD